MRYQRLALCIMLAASIATLGCRSLRRHALPPSNMLMHPGPGVGGPGPGVIGPPGPGMMMGMPNMGGPTKASSSQLAFIGPDGMVIRWETGGEGFDSEPLVAPGRYNFPQGAIYRVKLTNIPGREGVELYPSIEVGPATPRTEAYIAHNPVPVQFTEEDFDQVLTGNFVTKVIYLPDPEFQELALAGVETLVSTRLDPGVDPIVEADRRGSILAIIRLGGKDEELPEAENGGGAPADANVVPASYGAPVGAPSGPPAYGPPLTGVMGGSTLPNGYVAGVTRPQYGMPITGTPIGLPGPPHIPLGVPAGLQKHVIKNYTRVNLPEPTKKLKLHVLQSPGISYPKPAKGAFIWENTVRPFTRFKAPWTSKHQLTPDGGR
jgi:hypothetical protein